MTAQQDTGTALVTGASRGLGLALTRALVARGWHVVADARDAGVLTGALAGLGAAVTAVPGDVTDAAHREALAAAVGATGRLDLLVNNASALGPSPLPSLATLDPRDLRRVLDVNVVAPLALAGTLMPLLRRSGGAVVDVSSDAAVEAYEGWGGYGASKAALDHATRVLAAEEPSVHVYAVDPGDMRTQMHADAFPGEDISDRPLPEAVVPALLALVDGRRPSGRYRLDATASASAPATADAVGVA